MKLVSADNCPAIVLRMKLYMVNSRFRSFPTESFFPRHMVEFVISSTDLAFLLPLHHRIQNDSNCLSSLAEWHHLL